MITLVPLAKLHVSPRNARTTNPDEDVDWLANDIAEKGLLQNLVVVPEEDGLFGPGDLGIVEGGRRYRALMRNVELGKITVDELVPVLVKDIDDGRTLSLTSAIHKVDLNPADQSAAYAAIVEEHAAETDPVAYCARRCGVSEHHVRQRMRLAALAPEILEQLRAGALSIDAAEAYAGFDDQALQLHVFMGEEARSFGPRHQPRNIRDALRSRTYPATIAQAIFIGIDAYIDAGGRTDQDLFMGHDEGERLLDPSLVDDLARRKAMEQLPDIAAGDGFAEGKLANSFAALPTWPRPPADFALQPALTWPKAKKERPAGAIGLYALAANGKGLELGQWWKPKEPIIPQAPPAAAPAGRQDELQAAIDKIDGSAARRSDERRHLDQQRRLAAQLVVERTLGAAIGDVFHGAACWPVDDLYVPTVCGAEGDPDSVLVAVQIRIAKADWEAAMPEAEKKLEERIDA